MSKTKFIADRLKEVFLDGKWIANTNIKEQIVSLNWIQATHKIDSLNTIAELTYHINYYLEGILTFFDKGKLDIQDKYSFDLPPIQSESEWQNLILNFISNSKKFIVYIEKMDDTKLDEIFVDDKYDTYNRNIIGVLEHSYYHLGQISLIKKMILLDK